MAKLIYKPTNFTEAKAIISRPNAKVRGQVKLAYNTYLQDHVESDGHYLIRYHRTAILRLYPTYTSYFTGGWETATTKQRLNALMPPGFWLYQTDFEWFVSRQMHIEDENELYEFEEGFTIHHDGSVSGAKRVQLKGANSK